MREVEGKGWTPNVDNYWQIAKSFGKAGDCIGCKRCESVCPQHLKISNELKNVANCLEITY